MKKYLYIKTKFYLFEKTWSARYLADEDVYNEGDFIYANYNDEDTPMIVIGKDWYDEENVPWPLDKMKKIIRRSSYEEYLEHNKNRSILNYILSNLDTKSKLPNDFSLNHYKQKDEIQFVDGAIDGIGYFHAELEPDQKLIDCVSGFLKEKKILTPELVEKIEEHFIKNKFLVLASIDDIRKMLVENPDKYDVNYYVPLASFVVYISKNIELIKLAIGILGLIDLDSYNKDLKYIFEKVSICNEFTMYVMYYIFPQFKENEDLLFKTAKRVTGWGRVFITYALNLNDENIKKWIFKEGYHNDIDPNYTSLYLINKLNILDMLKNKNIDSKTMDCIYSLINNTIIGGPYKTFEQMENYKELFDAFLENYDEHRNELYYLATVKNMYIYENDDYKEAFDIMEKDETYSFIINKFKNGSTMDCINLIDICKKSNKHDYSEFVLKKFKEDIIINSYCLCYLLKNEKTKFITIEILENNMPDYIDFDDETICNFANFIYELEEYPGIGEKYIEIAVTSPIDEIKNKAINVINEWNKNDKYILPEDWEKYIYEE